MTMRKVHAVMWLLCSFCLGLPVFAFGNVAVHDGHYVYYTDTGTGAPAVVLVHGWACNSTFWQPQVENLSEEYRVIAIDLPGHGRSAAPERAYTPAYFANAVNAVLEEADVTGAVLIGHSMGATVVRWTAWLHPGRVAGLVFADGVIFVPPEDVEGEKLWQQQMDGFVASFAEGSVEDNTRSFIASLHAPETPALLKERIEAQMLATPEHVRASAMAELLTVQSQRIAPLAVPLLAIYWDNEEVMPVFEEQLDVLFGDLTFQKWGDTGHFLMMEHPERFNRAVRTFIQHIAR